MIQPVETDWKPSDTQTPKADLDRLVLVTAREDDPRWVDALRADYPLREITTCDTYLRAIAELSRRSATTVLAAIDSSVAQVEHAVAAIRQAAGDEARLILSCTTDQEPLAQRLLAHGADDYVVRPHDRQELDRALGYARISTRSPNASPSASMEELVDIGKLLAHLGDRPNLLLKKLAELIGRGLNAPGTRVVVEGSVAAAGTPVTQPALSATMTSGGGAVTGHIGVAARSDRSYSAADAAKLEHYARVAGLLLEADGRQRRLRRLAMTDECSGLANRRHLLERLDEILAQAQMDRFPVSFLLFDVDNFKAYNDTFGHDVGDDILRAMGALFQRHCREHDLVARFGGDEFAVVFWDPDGPRVSGSQHPDCALAVLDRALTALRSQELPPLETAQKGVLTISGGLATYPWDATTREELIKRADEALLAAKRAGKNRIYRIEP